MSTVTTKNYKVRLQFAKDIVERMGIDEVRHYKKEFGQNVAQTIYEYGCLDCYDYDLYKTLVDLGVNTKPVREYSKVLDGGCTDKHREDIRNEYVKAITYALPLVETFKDMEV